MNQSQAENWPAFLVLDKLPCMLWFATNPVRPSKVNKSWAVTVNKQILAQMMASWDSCVHPLDRVGRTIAIQRAFSTRQAYKTQFRLKISKSKFVWVSEQADPVFDDYGEFQGLVGMVMDISPYKEHESTLSQLGTIIESSDDAIYSIDLNDRLLSWNRGAQQLYGYHRDEIIGEQIVRKIIPKGKITEFLQSKNRIIRGEEVNVLDTVRKKKNGELFDASLSYSPLKDSDNNIIGLSVIARDISVQKKAQTELTRLLNHLDSLVKHAPIGIAFLDKNLRYVLINEYLSAIDGLSIEDHQNKTPKDVLPQSLAEKVMQSLKKVQTTKIPVSLEIEGHTRANPHFNRWWWATYYPIQVNASEDGVGCIIQDITEQKNLEKRKDDFISMASHELKTPVTSIKAFTQLMKRSALNPKQKDYLTKTENQTNRLIHIINEMLDVSRIRTGRFIINKEKFAIGSLVEEMVNMFAPTHTSHRIHIHNYNDCIVEADRMRLGQVITNLLSNAVKYSPYADKVDIKLEKLDEKVKFSIQDYGIGISKINQKKIFQTFYRVVDIPEGEFPGLGIGLSIASQIINLHGGEIGVKSTENKGSMFWFTLPCSNP